MLHFVIKFDRTEEEERIEKIKYKKRGKSLIKKINLMPGLR